MNMTRMLIIAFAQAFSTGSIPALTIARNWPMLFVAAFILNLLWWINVGNRIDLHGKKGMAVLYAFTFASGLMLGAWVWR